MGNNSSLAEAGSRLAKQDVARLQRRFSRLAGPDALVSIEQLQSIVELGANPFVVAFRLYDVDGDGFVGGTDLYNTLSALSGRSHSDAQMEQGDGGLSPATCGVQVVHNTLLHFDEDGDNKLSMEEFKALLASSSL
ncbi:hypothetical protein QJQ45_010490 [Haematococcus lacustris]|nr:hypothetical protein QJQ45_010490 [Haematococcus lacustris]